jgi:hypothetical protein
VPGVFVGCDVAVAGVRGLAGIGVPGVFVGCGVVVADAPGLEGIGVAGVFVGCGVVVADAPGLEGITERPVDGDPIGRIIPGVRAGADGSPRDLVGVSGIFSAFAELTGSGGFTCVDVDVSDCTVAGLVVSDALVGAGELGGVAGAAGTAETVGLGVSGTLVGSEELSGAARAAGTIETVGLGVSATLARSDDSGGVVEAAGGFVTLLVGRVGKTGGRVAVLGRMGLLSNFFGENVCLVSGCNVRAGEPDVVLSPAGVCAGVFVSSVLGVDAGVVGNVGNGFPLFWEEPQTLQKRASSGISVLHL